MFSHCPNEWSWISCNIWSSNKYYLLMDQKLNSENDGSSQSMQEHWVKQFNGKHQSNPNHWEFQLAAAVGGWGFPWYWQILILWWAGWVAKVATNHYMWYGWMCHDGCYMTVPLGMLLAKNWWSYRSFSQFFEGVVLSSFLIFWQDWCGHEWSKILMQGVVLLGNA